ncbi:MAG TPA: hypothetical protein P5277_03660 [Candidatus Paceibacterota bacterium]|nr:hypothetical protein [Candidatus Paceibacterota bacterium]
MNYCNIISRRELLEKGLIGLTTISGLSKIILASEINPKTDCLNSKKDILKILSEKEKIDYYFIGKSGKETITASIDKKPEVIYFQLTRKSSRGFLSSINYYTSLQDDLKTGIGNIDSATFGFKDNRDHQKKESSEIKINFSQSEKNNELIKNLEEVYYLLGYYFITKKTSIYNQDIVQIDKIFSKVFENYKISLPLAEIIKKKEIEKTEKPLETDIKGFTMNSLKIITKTGRPK